MTHGYIQHLCVTRIDKYKHFYESFHLSVEVYQVTVHTGDRWAAHTNATVWVNLHGDQGDSGKRILYHSSVEGTMFMKDKKDVFNVEAVSLGMLKMVEIGHDGIGYGKSVIILKTVFNFGKKRLNTVIDMCKHFYKDV